jgi:SAM-dependent methyltransferase
MKDVYLNPELYDALHNDIGTDENVIKYYAKKCNGSVLEIACGTGRLSKYIIDLGLPYTGIDNSKPFLDISVQKFGKNGTFLYNNMQDFKLAEKFDFIFIGFNSFLHNLTDKDALNCLRCVREHLNNDGIFLLSIFLPDPEFLYQTEYLHEARTFFNYKGKQCRVMEKNSYNDETQINSLTWQLEIDGKLSDETYSFKQRMFYPHKMHLLFQESGFSVNEKFGDWDMNPMDEESPLQIYICK